jgi:hypothetical protein
LRELSTDVHVDLPCPVAFFDGVDRINDALKEGVKPVMMSELDIVDSTPEIDEHAPSIVAQVTCRRAPLTLVRDDSFRSRRCAFIEEGTAWGRA